jgi:23S rRNA pseudouridine955/2504/2580 synthase
LKRVEILFENDNLIVLNKPAGLAVQGGEGVKTSLDKLLAEEYSPRPLLVHRLDRDTSGIILAARNREAASALAPLFGGRSPLEKYYLAVCAGSPLPAEGAVRDRLIVKGRQREALTVYTVRGNMGEYSLLELKTGTGRMHQIRRHLAGIGHPILGDDKYGDFSLNRRLRKTRGLKRLLLHAWRLVIPPVPRLGLKETLELSAPLPGCFSPFTEEPGGDPALPGVRWEQGPRPLERGP